MTMEINSRGSGKFRLDLFLALAMLAAAFFNLYGIWKDTYANTYYTTAVGSMLQSWHNFFYGSLDSAGSVTVDKPPVRRGGFRRHSPGCFASTAGVLSCRRRLRASDRCCLFTYV